MYVHTKTCVDKVETNGVNKNKITMTYRRVYILKIILRLRMGIYESIDFGEEIKYTSIKNNFLVSNPSFFIWHTNKSIKL
jgi:hypothetical protein